VPNPSVLGGFGSEPEPIVIRLKKEENGEMAMVTWFEVRCKQEGFTTKNKQCSCKTNYLQLRRNKMNGFAKHDHEFHVNQKVKTRGDIGSFNLTITKSLLHRKGLW